MCSLIPELMSLINKRNMIESKTVPWGVPDVILTDLDLSPSTTTV